MEDSGHYSPTHQMICWLQFWLGWILKSLSITSYPPYLCSSALLRHFNWAGISESWIQAVTQSVLFTYPNPRVLSILVALHPPSCFLYSSTKLAEHQVIKPFFINTNKQELAGKCTRGNPVFPDKKSLSLV